MGHILKQITYKTVISPRFQGMYESCLSEKMKGSTNRRNNIIKGRESFHGWFRNQQKDKYAWEGKREILFP